MIVAMQLSRGSEKLRSLGAIDRARVRRGWQVEADVRLT